MNLLRSAPAECMVPTELASVVLCENQVFAFFSVASVDAASFWKARVQPRRSVSTYPILHKQEKIIMKVMKTAKVYRFQLILLFREVLSWSPPGAALLVSLSPLLLLLPPCPGLGSV